ncbi:plasmid mobilization protein [Inquilinus sp.]|jgi:hypothetical protein|uniref:plasmid mobilization protein n=1 Tax=Inquilinus sp. TaxID=1932117 RepID=UPI00378335C2
MPESVVTSGIGKGQRGKRTRQIHLRISEEDFCAFHAYAGEADLPLSELIRRRVFGSRIVSSRPAMALVNELRRQGGLMKYLALRGQPVRDIGMDILDIAKRIEAQADVLLAEEKQE